MEQEIKTVLETINQQVKELSAFYHRAASRYNISGNEFWVWYALLVLDGEQSQQSICEMWSLPKQTVNSVISSMVKKGHVYLEVIPGTRNKKVIRLTPAGQEFGTQVITRIYSAEQHALECMTFEERQHCASLLTKYTDLLRKEL